MIINCLLLFFVLIGNVIEIPVVPNEEKEKELDKIEEESSEDSEKDESSEDSEKDEKSTYRNFETLINKNTLGYQDLQVLKKFVQGIDTFTGEDFFATTPVSQEKAGTLLLALLNYKSKWAYFTSFFQKYPSPEEIKDLEKQIIEKANSEFLNIKDADKNTALHLAVKNGLIDLFELIIAKNVDFTIQNSNGETFLHLIFQAQNFSDYSKVFKNDEIIQVINIKDAKGQTPFEIGFGKYGEKIISALTDGTVKAIICQGENNLLHLLAQRRISDLNEKFWAELINQQNSTQDTPLHLALKNSNKSFTEKLISKNISFDSSIKDKDGNTALHLAVQHDNLDFFREILSSDKRMASLTIKNSADETPVHIIYKKHNFQEFVKIIPTEDIEKTYDVQNKAGETPLAVGLRVIGYQAVNSVAEQDRILMIDAKGNNLLHILVKDGKCKQLNSTLWPQLINRKNKEEKTPLDVAVDMEGSTQNGLLQIFSDNTEQRISNKYFFTQIISRKISIDLTTPQYGASLLKLALEKDLGDLATYILNSKIQLQERDQSLFEVIDLDQNLLELALTQESRFLEEFMDKFEEKIKNVLTQNKNIGIVKKIIENRQVKFLEKFGNFINFEEKNTQISVFGKSEIFKVWEAFLNPTYGINQKFKQILFSKEKFTDALEKKENLEKYLEYLIQSARIEAMDFNHAFIKKTLNKFLQNNENFGKFTSKLFSPTDFDCFIDSLEEETIEKIPLIYKRNFLVKILEEIYNNKVLTINNANNKKDYLEITKKAINLLGLEAVFLDGPRSPLKIIFDAGDTRTFAQVLHFIEENTASTETKKSYFEQFLQEINVNAIDLIRKNYSNDACREELALSYIKQLDDATFNQFFNENSIIELAVQSGNVKLLNRLLSTEIFRSKFKAKNLDQEKLKALLPASRQEKLPALEDFINTNLVKRLEKNKNNEDKQTLQKNNPIQVRANPHQTINRQQQLLNSIAPPVIPTTSQSFFNFNKKEAIISIALGLLGIIGLNEGLNYHKKGQNKIHNPGHLNPKINVRRKVKSKKLVGDKKKTKNSKNKVSRKIKKKV